MITGINESKILTKVILCECKLKFDKKKCNSNQKWNNDKCWCKSKKHHLCEKDYIWNPATCSCKNGKYLVKYFWWFSDDVWWNYRRNKENTPTNFNQKRSLSNTKCLYFTCIFINYHNIINSC